MSDNNAHIGEKDLSRSFAVPVSPLFPTGRDTLANIVGKLKVGKDDDWDI